MTRLSEAVTAAPPEGLRVPPYARADLRAGIVHFGPGHFHRAHQAVYLDDLLARGGSAEWGICAAGTRPENLDFTEALAPQDHLYTLTEKEPDGTFGHRVIGSIIDSVVTAEDPAAVIEEVAAPETRIVTLTITEGGYPIDQVSGTFQPDEPLVAADLEAELPNGTVFGIVLQAMARRRERGLPGITVLSCDNVEDNGHVARESFLGFARLKDPETATWMEANLTFPSCMVDRVTPGTVDADRAHVREALGHEDEWPVTCEPFRQWVVEDDFANGRPALEQVGVEMVDDVRPYEVMKLRLANGTHQALCYAGHLLGLISVHEAIADPEVDALLRHYADVEAIPTLTPINGTDFADYARTVRERFGNPQIKDPLRRICADTSDRIPKFLLPVAHDRLGAGGEVRACAAVVALWARYSTGTDEQGRPIEVVDPRQDAITAAARAARTDPVAFLADRSLFGDLADREDFVEPFASILNSLYERGTRATLRSEFVER